MNKDLKKHIRLLADKFNHRIEYHKDIVILKNDINEIKIWEADKFRISISYNVNKNAHKHLKIKNENVYDILLDLLNRKEEGEKLIIKTGILLTIEEWIKEEGEFVKEQIEKLKKDLEYKKINYRELGGNRYEVEYFNGILILTDDLCWAKSNVFSI